VPEAPFSIDRFLEDVDRVYAKHGRCVAAVCEGIVADDDVPMLLKLKDVEERDQFGNLQLSGRSTLGDALSDAVKARLKITRVRCDTFGYLQRSFLGVISGVDASEARDVGETAVHFAVHGKRNGSVAIRRTGDYSVDYFLTSLESVAANTKPLPAEYLKGLNDIDESFKIYARPLMGPLAQFDRLIAPSVRVVKRKTELAGT
jgi:6-phosphofructokinase 1